MDRRLTRALLVVAIVVILYLNLAGANRVFAEEEEEASRGLFGEALNTLRLQNLVENLYAFKSRVLSRGGFDEAFLNWFTPNYSGFSKSVLSSPLGLVATILVLPAAVFLSTCLPLYSQIGIIGVVLAAGFLTGLVYTFPLFLIIEVFSKTGLVAKHGRTLIIILLVLMTISAILLMYSYGYVNTPVFFVSCILLVAITWVAWFLPILLYYHS